MGKRSWIGLVVLALLAALWSSCGGDETTPSGASTPGAPTTERGVQAPEVTEGEAEMAVDVESGGEITATAQVSGSSPFQVDVLIRGATTGYQGYQYYLEWDPKILAFDSHTDLKPAELNLCANPTSSESRVAAGCVRTTETTTFAGPVATISFHCVSAGTSSLHLMSSKERPESFSAAMAPRGLVIPTNLVDASVTCLGG